MLPKSQEQALRFAQSLKTGRQNWDSLFERCAEQFLPNRTGFNTQRSDGEDRQDHLNSSVPLLARRGLSAAVSTMLRPPGRMWAQGRVKFEELNADPDVRMWLDRVTTILFAYLYDPRAKMEPQCAMADDDLVTFGNACIRVGFDPVGKHLKFRTRSMANTYFVPDASGNINGVVSFENPTLREIRDKFGDKALTSKMKQEMASASPNLEKRFELVHIVIPVADAAAFGMKFKQPFSSLWMSVSCNESLESKGFDFFPYICPRWDMATEEVYGRSPAMVALRDAQLLQAMTETLIDAGEKALNPPLWGYADMLNGQVDLSAGGFTPVENQFIGGNMAPITPLQLGTMPREIFEFMQATEERIGQAFYRDILELPSARDKDLTATEINARLDQYMRQAAPVFSRIEHSYNAPLIKTVYAILDEMRMLPPKPEIVVEAEAFTQEEAIEFDYESPIKQARDKAEAMRIFEGLGTIISGASQMGEQAMMQVAENFNPDAYARGIGQRLDIPEWLFTPLDQMMEGRQARMQQMEQMQMAEMAGKAGPAVAQMGRLIPEAAKAGLIDAGGGAEQGLLPAPDSIPFDEIAGLEEAML